MTNVAILPALGTEPEPPVPTQGRGSGFSLPGPTPAETEQPSEYCGDDGWRRGISLLSFRQIGELGKQMGGHQQGKFQIFWSLYRQLLNP